MKDRYQAESEVDPDSEGAALRDGETASDADLGSTWGLDRR